MAAPEVQEEKAGGEDAEDRAELEHPTGEVEWTALMGGMAGMALQEKAEALP